MDGSVTVVNVQPEGYDDLGGLVDEIPYRSQRRGRS